MTNLAIAAAPAYQLQSTPQHTVAMEANMEVRPNESRSTSVHFLESNTNSITLDDLSNTCIVPTYADQTLTLSHQDFINTVWDAAKAFYNAETINVPEVRVSHEIQGRIPSALHKAKNELLETDKTRFFQRLAFAFTIPTIWETINGQRMELCVGGVRNYNDYALYRASKGIEKFSVFVGWRVNICSNQVLTGQGLQYQMEVSSLEDLYRQVYMLFSQFSPAKDIYMMQTLANTYLTEQQFANVVGRMRLYQALPPTIQKSIPRLLITDCQINSCCRQFYSSREFGVKEDAISMWDFHNLLTESNKSSYIDSYLQRAINATEVSMGINNALQGISTDFDWFLH